MNKLLLSTAAIVMTVSGCETTSSVRYRPSEFNRHGLEVTQQICNVDALAEEKKTALSVTNDSRESIAAYQNKYGDYDERTNTILMEKLNWYEAEIEASYRFVTQTCGAYMRCLEYNHHDEQQCKRSETLWERSQERFASLSLEIRNIAAEVEIKRINAKNKKKSRHNHLHAPKGQCCDAINSIFTDCCG